jgi:alkylation response protein AidB-like acyl-CoA dehydrogenase
MDFHDSPDEAAFRGEVQRFIKENFTERRAVAQPPRGTGRPAEMDPARAAQLEEWRSALAARGWIAAPWPKEYGGAGMTPVEQFIFNEEMARVRAPTFSGGGVTRLGPILIMYGTDEQKREFLPDIASGKSNWCQGYSEPGAGSDLASLQTRAVRDGDEFVVNGQKIWTSGAHTSDRMYMLARTDPDAPKHRGISMLLLDMKSPGITIRPLINLAGDHGFNEVFFDSVRVPAKNLVGELNRGWYVGATLLDFERSSIGSAIGLQHQVDDMVRFVKQNRGTVVRDQRPLTLELSDRRVEAEVSAMFSYRIITMQKRGQVPNYEASVSKNFRSEVSQRMAQTSMRLIGLYGNLALGAPFAPARGRYAHMYLTSMSATIAAGTSEINRNVIATRGLGLPRG